VLGPDYKPIPGLYAVGKIAGGIYGVDYPQLMTGIDNGRALTWALALADAVKDTN
jgi:predicted oxidoreductase